MTRYVSVRSEKDLWTVGYFDPDGDWHSVSDHGSYQEAMDTVATLNGAPRQNIELRDKFAGQALIGLLASSPHDGFGNEYPITKDRPSMPLEDRFALAAYRVADAMLRARTE